MYSIEFVDAAAKDFRALQKADRRLAGRVQTAIDDLARDPFQGKALNWDLKGRFSLRIGSYRVIYSVHKDRLVVLVLDLGHRREIYR